MGEKEDISGPFQDQDQPVQIFQRLTYYAQSCFRDHQLPSGVSCFEGFGDDDGGFFAVYSDLFQARDSSMLNMRQAWFWK